MSTIDGTTGWPRCAPASILLILLASPSIAAAPADTAVGSAIGPQMTITEGKSTLMRLAYPVKKVAVGDSRIADVILLNKSEVYMVGKSPGSTNLILWNKNDDATIVDIAVQLDTSLLQGRLAEVFPAEKEIRVRAAADSVILSGMVSDAGTAEQVMAIATAYLQKPRSGNLASAGAVPTGAGAQAASALAPPGQAPSTPVVINLLTVAAPQQVMLEVKVAEISKTLVDQLGASFNGVRTNGNFTYGLVSNLLAGVPALAGASKNGNVIQFDAQRRNGLVKVLAEPTIMAISGQEASFLAGGKIFIPVSVTNNNGNADIRLEEKEFGIAVRFTPTVLAGGRINLRVAPEVSDLNKDGIGITAAGVSGAAILPSFTTRRATTTVQLFDGQSFAIGGLIKNNVTTSVKAIPMLGEIPVLGALFRSSDFQTDRTELVFVITPHLVKPLPANYPLPTDGYVAPGRAEFFLHGKQEGSSSSPPPAPLARAGNVAVPPVQASNTATGFDLR